MGGGGRVRRKNHERAISDSFVAVVDGRDDGGWVEVGNTTNES